MIPGNLGQFLLLCLGLAVGLCARGGRRRRASPPAAARLSPGPQLGLPYLARLPGRPAADAGQEPPAAAVWRGRPPRPLVAWPTWLGWPCRPPGQLQVPLPGQAAAFPRRRSTQLRGTFPRKRPGQPV